MFATACASSPPSAGPSYDSVRERLEDGPTRLSVGTAASSGMITARRWTPDGWIEGTTPVTIADGELVAALDAAGKLSVTAFEVGVEPIDIPEEVFDKPAQLSDVRVKLAEKVVEPVRWTSDDEASARVTLSLDLHWAIAISGGKTPLGTQHLPPVAIDVTLAGDGEHVDASISLDARGELWDWAGLIELTALELHLAAGTLSL